MTITYIFLPRVESRRVQEGIKAILIPVPNASHISLDPFLQLQNGNFPDLARLESRQLEQFRRALGRATSSIDASVIAAMRILVVA
jgi:hypothetical protein